MLTPVFINDGPGSNLTAICEMVERFRFLDFHVTRCARVTVTVPLCLLQTTVFGNLKAQAPYSVQLSVDYDHNVPNVLHRHGSPSLPALPYVDPPPQLQLDVIPAAEFPKQCICNKY